MLRALNLALQGQSLTRAEAAQMMDDLLAGTATPEQAGAMLAALRLKSESVDEIVGFVQSLQKQARPIPHQFKDLIDVCGTGGDGTGTFNISTTVSFVVAAAGQPTAKHGNRSVSSKSGSFDVLQALNLLPSEDPTQITSSITRFGLGLIFAPAFHPVLKKVSVLRRNLGVYTVFNILGPLLNPMAVKRQVIGVYQAGLLEKMTLVLREIGHDEAMVVHGHGGLDEFSISGPTQISHLKNGNIKNYTMTPEDAGLPRAPVTELTGGTAEENAEILLRILAGEKGPKRDVVLLNAAAALVVGGKARDFKDGVRLATETIESGRALETLNRMRNAQ